MANIMASEIHAMWLMSKVQGRPATLELEEGHQCSVCKLKLAEEKWKHASLVEQNGFGPAFLTQFAEAGKRHSKP
jgi:hypothetical protein